METTERLHGKYNRSQMIEKVRKLMALADGAGTEMEAQKATAKAQALMVQWNIEENELQTVGGQLAEKQVIEKRGWLMIKRTTWELDLVSLVGWHFATYIVQNKEFIWFCGTETDVTIAMHVFDQLRNKLETMSRARFAEFAQEWKVLHGGRSIYTSMHNMQSYRYKWLNNYLAGAVAGLREQLEAMRRQIESQVGSTALVVIDQRWETGHETAVQKWPALGKGRKTKQVRSNEEALARGYQDGKKVQINKGIEAPAARNKLLPSGE